MADIFVSYKKEDAGRVVRIVEGLRAEGFSVWWDHGIAPGSQWDQTIQKELEAAELVVAIWSELSVSAPWVKEEAGVGKAKGRLLPVRIDNVMPPLGFGLIQMADLIDWDGDLEDNGWDHFIEAARATIAGEPVKGLERPVRQTNRLLKFLPIIALMLLVAGSGIWAMNKLLSISEATFEYADGSNSTISRQKPSAPSQAEKDMFAKAQDSKLRADYLDYLRVYARGAYADRVREEILPFCANEERQIWKQMSTDVNGSGGQRLRGVSTGAVGLAVGSDDIVHATQDQACQAARKDVEQTASLTCEGFERGATNRNAQYTLVWPDECDCKFIDAGNTWICSVDPQFICDWEAQTVEFVELCK